MLSVNENVEREAAKMVTSSLLSSGVMRSCLNCESYAPNIAAVKQTGACPPACALVKQLPPPHVIVYGCEKWVHDIPF